MCGIVEPEDHGGERVGRIVLRAAALTTTRKYHHSPIRMWAHTANDSLRCLTERLLFRPPRTLQPLTSATRLSCIHLLRNLLAFCGGGWACSFAQCSGIHWRHFSCTLLCFWQLLKLSHSFCASVRAPQTLAHWKALPIPARSDIRHSL